VTLSPGKQKGLAALSTDRGIIAALAIDQRSALRKLFAKAAGRAADDIPADLLANFKSHVSRILTPHASAILLDPELGLPAAAARAPEAGLLLAYEQTGYDKSVPGRLPRLLDGFSAAKLRALGADAVKVLLYYSPFSASAINAQKLHGLNASARNVLPPTFLFFWNSSVITTTWTKKAQNSPA